MMADLPTTMKAWTITQVGKPKDVLRLQSNWPTPPPPKAGNILIKVSHASLNPGDCHLMKSSIPFRYPAIPAMDCVGKIVQIGQLASSSTSDMRVGMTVAGSMPVMQIMRGNGTLAEYVVLPAHAVVEKPKGLEEVVAAGLLGIAGQTSATVLRATRLHQGDRVLVNGASGGVGSVLTQVLHGMGMRVTGICSARNEALVRRLGAEEVVDYTAYRDLYGHLSSICMTPGNVPFDTIIDCVGSMPLLHKSSAYLKPTGKCISIEGSFLQEIKSNYLPVILGGSERTYKSIMTYPSGDLAKTVAGWFDKGWVKEVPIDSIFSMDEAMQAFEKQATGRPAGKIFVRTT